MSDLYVGSIGTIHTHEKTFTTLAIKLIVNVALLITQVAYNLSLIKLLLLLSDCLDLLIIVDVPLTLIGEMFFCGAELMA